MVVATVVWCLPWTACLTHSVVVRASPLPRRYKELIARAGKRGAAATAAPVPTDADAAAGETRLGEYARAILQQLRTSGIEGTECPVCFDDEMVRTQPHSQPAAALLDTHQLATNLVWVSRVCTGGAHAVAMRPCAVQRVCRERAPCWRQVRCCARCAAMRTADVSLLPTLMQAPSGLPGVSARVPGLGRYIGDAAQARPCTCGSATGIPYAGAP